METRLYNGGLESLIEIMFINKAQNDDKVFFSSTYMNTCAHDELHTVLKFTAGYGFLFLVSCKLR